MRSTEDCIADADLCETLGGHMQDWKAAFILGRPHGLHNAIMLPNEERQWQVSQLAHTSDSGYVNTETRY